MFQYIENIFLQLDEWAYDIEQEYKNTGFVLGKKKRQYINICATRDKYYDIYLKRIENINNGLNHRNHYYGCSKYIAINKSCTKRFPPPKIKKIPNWIDELSTVGRESEMRHIDTEY